MEQINNVIDLMNLLEDVEYGWMDINKNVYLNTEKGFKKKYCLSRPEEVIEKKVGTCYDQVELERKYFKDLGLTFNTYFMIYYDAKKLYTHTFLVYEENEKSKRVCEKLGFKFEKKELADEEFQKARDYCLESINLTMAELAENYVKLDQKHFKPINDNIVYLGMKNTFNLIYNERYNKKEKNKHNNK